jgi:hypothetical protein
MTWRTVRLRVERPFCVLGDPQDASIGLPTRGGQTTYRIPRPRVPVQDKL